MYIYQVMDRGAREHGDGGDVEERMEARMKKMDRKLDALTRTLETVAAWAADRERNGCNGHDSLRRRVDALSARVTEALDRAARGGASAAKEKNGGASAASPRAHVSPDLSSRRGSNGHGAPVTGIRDTSVTAPPPNKMAAVGGNPSPGEQEEYEPSRGNGLAHGLSPKAIAISSPSVARAEARLTFQRHAPRPMTEVSPDGYDVYMYMYIYVYISISRYISIYIYI